MLDTEIGLSMASEYDPSTQTQVTVSGELYNYIVLLLLLATNLQSYLVRAFVDSYTLIPINGQVFDWDHLLTSVITYATDLMIVAFRIILPVFACIMILNCILGIMAKVAPQMNMFAVGMQLKLLVGLAAILIVVALMPYVSDYIFTEMKKMVVMFVQSLY
jgi:flagellar biosynthetic protein FliR